MLFGGHATNDSNAGLVYAHSDNTPSTTDANIGSHLCLGTIYRATTSPLGGRFITPNRVGRNALIGYRRLGIRKQSARNGTG